VRLCFAAPWPIVRRSAQRIMVDGDRVPLNPGETPEMRVVRFRKLGCYRLTAAAESTATTIAEIVEETHAARTSEGQGRLIDHGGGFTMFLTDPMSKSRLTETFCGSESGGIIYGCHFMHVRAQAERVR